MNAVTQPVGPKLPPTDHAYAVREWLDALASGGCDQAAFLRSMQERFLTEPEGHWEVLAQLDQYFRRGKIKPDTFHAIKTALAGAAMGMSGRPGLPVTAPALALAVSPPAKAAERGADAGRGIEVGDVLRGRYRIVGVLGQGGMGMVFEALDDYRLEAAPCGQRVAIKVLHTNVTLRAELLNELRREFQHLQALSHPNVVRVHDFDRDGPLAFFTMELLDGALLSRVLQARQGVPLAPPLALAVIRDLGAAVAHAHSRGVVHGDINPQNIFITLNGELRVLDFGASHLLKDAAADDNGITVPFATPGFASCQVLEGERPEVRDDIFALACVAYLALSGTHPYADGTALGARATGLRPSRPAALTHRQWRALRAGLRFERDRRPVDLQPWLRRLGIHDAAEHLPPLAELLKAPVPPRKKLAIAAVLLIIVAIMAGAYWVIGRENRLSSPSTAPDRDATVAAGMAAPSSSAETPPDAANAAGGNDGRATHWGDTAPSVVGAQLAGEAPTATTVSHQNAATQTAISSPLASQPSSPPSSPPVTSAAPTSSPPATAVATSEPPYRLPPTSPNEHAAAAPPSSASAAAPASRIEMAAATLEVAAGAQTAHIVVRRRGSLRGAAGFSWWTESGTAKPGIDFTAVSPQVEHFQDGKSSASLWVSLPDALRAGPKSFFVVIDQPEDGAKLGARALTMVTIASAD